MSYSSKNDVSNLLVGTTTSDIQEEWLDWADSYVDELTDRRFAVSNYVIEKKDILDETTNVVYLNHYPIREISYVKDDGDEIDSADYVVYYDEGIIKLDLETILLKVVQTQYFTKGYQKVEVKYKYGQSKTPDIISYFATLLAANLAANALESKITGLGVLYKEQIGDYSYQKRGGGKEGVIITLKEEIIRVEELVKRRYGNEPETKAV